jgi:hypothetical protein
MQEYEVAVTVKQTYVVRVRAASAVDARVQAGDTELAEVRRGKYRGTAIAASRAFRTAGDVARERGWTTTAG